jgi:molecular chaperone GrpE
MAEKNNKQDSGKPDDAQRAACDETVAVSRQEYEALKAGCAEAGAYQDKYLRAHAEFENAKKRLEKEKMDFVKYANEGFLYEFLPIVDNLEIAEKYIKEAKDFKAVREGVDMIQAQIQEFLKNVGIERMKTAGEKFDPHLHEAVETEDSKDKEDGLIVAELKPGYRLNGKLLRPASVRIVKRRD